MIEANPKQILLIAPDLLGESLSQQLGLNQSGFEVCLRQEQLKKHPSLVIWSIESTEIADAIFIETKRLKEKWRPSPLLLLLPSRLNLKPTKVLDLDCDGIVQNPDFDLLKEAIQTLFRGGRVVRLNDSIEEEDLVKQKSFLGLGSNIFSNSLEQINSELDKLDNLKRSIKNNIFLLFAIQGRKREIQSAKSILLWLWAPIHMSLIINNRDSGLELKDYSTSITVFEKNSKAVWSEIYNRIEEAINSGVSNKTKNIFAIQSLHQEKQKYLLLALLNQLNDVFNKLQNTELQDIDLLQQWLSLENEVRKEALRELSGNYTRIIFDGEFTSVSDQLLNTTDLSDIDEELPTPSLMLNSLILNHPLLVEGNLLPPDDPRALIKLEALIMNWVIRTGEIIASEVISVCSDWPESREYFLIPELISTRELERLRNQLNSQRRLQYLIHRPIQLYESKREYFKFTDGSIQSFLVNESRDNDLKKLGWWQKQVTLLVETRDALAPQLQSLLKYIGDFMVILLTNVLGRAIGLIGRGIAQGMGRTISR